MPKLVFISFEVVMSQHVAFYVIIRRLKGMGDLVLLQPSLGRIQNTATANAYLNADWIINPTK